MKQYKVFMTNLEVAPLQGQNPHGTMTKDFNELEAAQAFAENNKDKWDSVSIYRRLQIGNLAKIEQYHKGKRQEV